MTARRRTGYRPLTFLVWTFVIQAAAATFGVMLLSFLPTSAGLPLQIAASTSVASISAAAMARFLSLPQSWVVLNGILPLSIAYSFRQEMPGWVFGACGGILALLFLPTFWTRVPYVRTDKAAFALIAELLPLDKSFLLVDIGCGFGQLFAYLARERPNGRFLGVELSPLAYLGAKIRFAREQRVTIHFADMWKMPLSEADFVYAFLSPEPMSDLWCKAKEEMTSGACLISNAFEIPGVTATKVVPIGGLKQHALFVYQIPSDVKHKAS